MSQSKTALVTGGAGFIGSHMVDLIALLKQQVHHVAADEPGGAGHHRDVLGIHVRPIFWTVFTLM